MKSPMQILIERDINLEFDCREYSADKTHEVIEAMEEYAHQFRQSTGKFIHERCKEIGHNMYSVYSLNNDRSSFGLNKCSLCGHEESWQYDH
jgi:hypothetical protein